MNGSNIDDNYESERKNADSHDIHLDLESLQTNSINVIFQFFIIFNTYR